jgi:hypothetical protein
MTNKTILGLTKQEWKRLSHRVGGNILAKQPLVKQWWQDAHVTVGDDAHEKLFKQYLREIPAPARKLDVAKHSELLELYRGRRITRDGTLLSWVKAFSPTISYTLGSAVLCSDAIVGALPLFIFNVLGICAAEDTSVFFRYHHATVDMKSALALKDRQMGDTDDDE